MDDKQTQALKRLIKKLSALRKTLSKSERELLDTLILGASAEVEAHAMHSAKVASAKIAGAKIAGAKMAGAKVAGAVQSAEVEGHAMHGAKIAGAKIAGAKIAGAKVASAKIAGRQVVFDAATASYQVVD